MEEKNRSQDPPEDTVPVRSAAAEASLEEPLKKLQAERDALYDQLVRRQADFENYRKRTERELQEFRERAEADLVLALLPALDGFERALNLTGNNAQVEDYRKGVELIYKQLFDTLNRRGLKPVKALGESFDPFLHHALERIETEEFADQQIIEELQRGYTFKGRLLRPALVKVAVRKPAEDKQGNKGTES